MNKTVFILSCVASAAMVNATSLPFSGGALVIFFDNGEDLNCGENDLSKYPRETVQYWYNGSELWQVRTGNDKVNVKRVLSRPVYRGVSSIYAAAANLDPKNYTCTNWVVFDPNDRFETVSALSNIGINIGQLREEKGVWYWSE